MTHEARLQESKTNSKYVHFLQSFMTRNFTHCLRAPWKPLFQSSKLPWQTNWNFERDRFSYLHSWKSFTNNNDTVVMSIAIVVIHNWLLRFFKGLVDTLPSYIRDVEAFSLSLWWWIQRNVQIRKRSRTNNFMLYVRLLTWFMTTWIQMEMD